MAKQDELRFLYRVAAESSLHPYALKPDALNSVKKFVNFAIDNFDFQNKEEMDLVVQLTLGLMKIRHYLDDVNFTKEVDRLLRHNETSIRRYKKKE